MALDVVKDLNEYRAGILEKLGESTGVSQDWVDAHIWFELHSYAEFAKIGLELIGWSVSQKHGDWLLVLKLKGEDIQQVAFITSGTPTRCIAKTRKLLRNGGLQLFRDKFA